MIITTLIVSFLLACLPLVIGVLSFRYAANLFSRTIVTLSAVSFLLGLAQFGLLLGLSYRLFSPERMPKAQWAVQSVSIAGGMIMIVAGILWVGYFRKLIKEKPASMSSVQMVKSPAGRNDLPTPPSRKHGKEAQPDWFSNQDLDAGVFQLAAVTSRKKRPQPKASREKARKKGAEEQTFLE